MIIVVAMKLVNSSDPSQAQNEADSRLVLPPVPAEQPVDRQAPIADTNSDNKKGDTQLFEQVPIVPENKGQDSFEDMVKSLKEKEDKKQQEAQAGDPATPPTEPATIQGALKQNDAPSAQPSEPKAESKQHANVVKTKEQKQKEAKNEKVAKQPKATDVHKEKVAKQKPTKQTPASGGDEAHSGSYIQVFAVKHFNEKAPELGKLKAAGYAYKLYRTNVNGDEIIKVLVGPYSGAQLKSELAKIKQNAAPNAFIVNIK